MLANQIRKRIQVENLAEGVFFATEAELAEQYDASRVVVREAAMRLKSLGILESRKRKGLIVGRPDPLRLWSESLPSLMQSPEDRRELALLRYTLEVGAIESVVARATDDQIEHLSELAHQFEQVARAGGQSEKEDELELLFHGQLLKMTGSRLIAGMQHVLSCFFMNDEPASDSSASDETIWEHHAIVSAIRDRDLDRARSMIRLHFKWVLKIDHHGPDSENV